MSDADINGTVPEGWAVRSLGDLVEARYGKALPQTKRRDGSVAVYGSNGPVGYHDEAITDSPVIVIGRKGSVGAINFSDAPVWPIDTTYFVDKFAAFAPRFLRGLLVSLGLDQMDRSTAIPGLSRDQLYELEVPVPPLAEQDRIATRFDEIEARRTAIAERLVSAQAVVARLRGSVLAAACSGRLTEDWRTEHPDVDSGRLRSDLMEARKPLRERPSNTSGEHGLSSEAQLDLLPSSWSLVRIGDIFDVGTGATPLRKNRSYYDAGTIPWITSGAVNAGTITSPTELITPLALKETNVKLFPPGTLLVAMYGEGQTRGRVAELAIEAGTNQAVAAVLFAEDTERLRPFIRLFFEDSYRRIRALSVGGVQPNLNLGMIKDTLLPLPPFEEQVEIVRRTDIALATADRLASQIETVATTLQRVASSALAKAFRGELVPTEAQLAEAEGRGYETAERLLARVA